MLLLLAAGLGLACGAGDDAPEAEAEPTPRPSYPLSGPPQIFLITLDTLRTDFTTPYGSQVDTTPYLNAMAEQSVVYTRAYASMPTTDPSHLTMLTGLYPQEHGAMNNGVKPFKGLLDFAELMKRQGRKTAAFTSRAHLNPEGMRIDAFDLWDAPETGQRDARDTVDLALAHLETIKDEPFFFWLHVFDPHQPYESHDDTAPEILERLASLDDVAPVDGYGFYDSKIAPRQIERRETLYRADISHMDVHLQRFHHTLQAYGFDETAFILFAADHGEVMGELLDTESYGFNHGKALAHGELHIPLMVRPPGGREPARVDTVVENRAVFGTLVEAAGLEDEVGPTPKLPAPDREADPDAIAFTVRRTFLSEPDQPMLKGSRLAAVQGDWMLRRVQLDDDVTLELFDLAADPDGVNNVAAAHPGVVERLHDRILTWQAQIATATEGDSAEQVDPDTLESLESLGYLR